MLVRGGTRALRVRLWSLPQHNQILGLLIAHGEVFAPPRVRARLVAAIHVLTYDATHATAAETVDETA